MAIVKAKRNPEDIEPLLLYSLLSEPIEEVSGLHDEDRKNTFIEGVRNSIDRSLKNPSTMHGYRTQALFRAVLVGLGNFRLLTDEDSGESFYDGSNGDVRAPDFRVVDLEGSQALVEVKNVGPRSRDLLKVRSADFKALKAYAELMEVPLSFAVYWTFLNAWTLVGAEHFEQRGSNHELTAVAAMMSNSLSRFGDHMIGAEPPLKIRLGVEQVGESSSTPDGLEATVRIKRLEFISAGKVLESPEARRIAAILIEYGNWDLQGEEAFEAPDGTIGVIERTIGPPEVGDDIEDDPGFALAGTYSSMISSFYNQGTLDDDGSVQELQRPIEPGSWNLVRDDYWDDPSRELKLWKLKLMARSQAPVNEDGTS